MATVSASEANRSFSRLLRQVAAGESFTVLSRGRPVARISPASPDPRVFGGARAALLERLLGQPTSGGARDWRRDDLYD